MRLSWIIGEGGLLGSALYDALRRENSYIFNAEKKFAWSTPSLLGLQFTESIDNFYQLQQHYSSWEIYWAAGNCTISSSENQVDLEFEIFKRFITELYLRFNGDLQNGSFIFSSSAGAIYAGANSSFITELSRPSPTTLYAKGKLKQELLLTSTLDESTRLSILIARISTIYGVKQKNNKNQGLISTIIRNSLRNLPIYIHVPFDTTRDYIYSPDAAQKIINSARLIEKSGSVNLKIIASEKSMTIAEIISICKTITRKKPLIICNLTESSKSYSRLVHFLSCKLVSQDHYFEHTNPYIAMNELKKSELNAIKSKNI